MNTQYPHPTSHRELRALLRTIERGYDQKDIEALEDAYDLAEAVTGSEDSEVIEYINALRERLRYPDDTHYRMYTDKDLHELHLFLDQKAYGDFDEAMMEMEYDLRRLDNYRTDSDMPSGIFRPEFFTKEDRAIWTELQHVIDTYRHEAHGEPGDSSIDNAIRKLRSYQQKSYGALVPTLTATYRRNNEGFSVRLAWFDECLYVSAHVPFVEKIDEYFTVTSPIDGIADFTPECFPETFGEYIRGGVTQNNLFRFEL